LSTIPSYRITSVMAKPKVLGDRITVRLPTGTLAAIKASLKPDETMQGKLQAAIVRLATRDQATAA
jgi:hypothetical protein